MMRYLILGLLRFGGPRHGYALMKEYRDGSGRTISVGNVYRELQRLQASGLVRPATIPRAADPRRRPFEITAEGAAALDTWLNRASRDGIGGFADDAYALRAFFVLRVGPQIAPRVLGEWRDELNAGRRVLSRVRDQSGSAGGHRHDAAASTRSLWLGRHMKHLETDLEFVARLESELERTSTEGTRHGDCGR